MNQNPKSNKGLVGLFIALLVVAIILALMLVMCGRGGNVPATEPATTEGSVAEDTQEVTETVPEETTEETVPETTEEPTEETTQETTGGNSRPGGSSGGSSKPGSSGGATKPTDPTDSTEPTETEPPVEVSAPGTDTNAYTENVNKFPGEFTTVVIPSKAQMHYHVYTTGVSLEIEDAETAVSFGGKEYLPEEGVITIPLSGSAAEPNVLRIDNKGASGKALRILVKEAPGAKSNPIALESIESFKASLAAGDQDGMYHSWIANANGTIRLSVDSITPVGTAAEVVVTVGSKSYKLSEAENGILTFNVEEDDEVIIQVIAQPDAEGNYPAAEVTMKGETVLPMDLYVMNIPGTETTDVIAPGTALYYNLYGVGQTIMTINDADAWVIYDGQTYTPDESGVLTVEIAPGNPRIPAAMQIGNSGAVGKAMELNFVYPVGAYGNPEVLTELGDLVTNVVANTNGYYYTYTAEEDGLLTFRVWGKPEGETLKTDIILTNLNTYMQSSIWTFDEETQTDVENSTVEVLVAKGDEVMILVSVLDTETFATVDAQVSSEAYVAGIADSPITVLDDVRDESNSTVTMTTVEIPANMELYYAIPKISKGILTVTGQGNFKVIYNEVEYTSADGTLTIPEVSAVSTNEPAVISLAGDTTCTYEFLITFPLGNQNNPDSLHVGEYNGNTADVAAGEEEGYFYTWTATETGDLLVTMPSTTDDWQAYIYNKTTMVQTEVLKSDDDTDTLKVKVSEGDTIEVCVNSYNPSNAYDFPGATITFSAFLHGTEEDPIVVQDDGTDGDDTIDTMTTTQIPMGAKFYYAIPQAEGVTITITANSRFSVEYNGETYSPARGKKFVTINNVTGAEEDLTAVFALSSTVARQTYKIEVTYPAVQQILLMQLPEGTVPTLEQELTLPPEEEALIPQETAE